MPTRCVRVGKIARSYGANRRCPAGDLAHPTR